MHFAELAAVSEQLAATSKRGEKAALLADAAAARWRPTRSTSPSACSPARRARVASASAGRRCATCDVDPAAEPSLEILRGRPGDRPPGGDVRRRRRRRPPGAAGRRVRAGDGGRAAAAVAGARRRAAPGRARRRDGRRRRQGGRRADRRGAPGAHAVGRPRASTARGRAVRRRGGAGRGRAWCRAGRCSRCWRRRRPTSPTALAATGPASVEWKLDGARIQAHRRGGDVRLFTRNLNEITDRLGAVAALVADLPGGDLVLDGEVLGVDDEGAPRRFQDTMGDFGADAPTGRGRGPVGVLLRRAARRRARRSSTSRWSCAARSWPRSCRRRPGCRRSSPPTPTRRRRSSTGRSAPATRA